MNLQIKIIAGIFAGFSTPSFAACVLPASSATAIKQSQTFTYNMTASQYGNFTSANRSFIWNNSGDVAANFRLPSGILSSGYTAVNRYPANSHTWGTATVTGRDITWFRANHPDWILLKADKATVAYYGRTSADTSYVPLDISNGTVRTWRLTNEIDVMLTSGLQGISVDNVGAQNNYEGGGVDDGTFAAGVCSIAVTSGNCTSNGGVWTALYSGNPDGSCPNGTGTCWTNDQVTWLTQLTSHVNGLNGCVTANVGYDASSTASTTDLIDSVNIWFDEAGYIGDTNPPACAISNPSSSTGAEWVAKLYYTAQRASPKVENGGICPLNNQNRQILQWSLASHLLTKGNNSYLESYFVDDSYYSDWVTGGAWPDLYWTHGAAVLPPPGSSPPYDIASGTYYRIFANGGVFVNPSTTTETVYQLGSGVYHSFDGLRYTGNLNLPPMTAFVLVKGEPPNGSVPRN